MSYDLMVFDSLEAPHSRSQFLAWFQTALDEASEDPNQTTVQLRGWYEDIRRMFPNMNGPGGPSAHDDLSQFGDRLADYSIGKHLIYVSFQWTVAEDAYETVRETAVAHKVGFFDISGDENDPELHFPGDPLRPPSQGAWRQVAKQFREMKKK